MWLEKAMEESLLRSNEVKKVDSNANFTPTKLGLTQSTEFVPKNKPIESEADLLFKEHGDKKLGKCWTTPQ